MDPISLPLSSGLLPSHSRTTSATPAISATSYLSDSILLGEQDPFSLSPRDSVFTIPRKPVRVKVDQVDQVEEIALLPHKSSDASHKIHHVQHPTGSDFRSRIKNKKLNRVPFSSPFRLRWWLPEICASLLSIASLLSTSIVLRQYDGRSLSNLNLPRPLTLNGIIAALATFNRVCLIAPVQAAITPEAWLWFSGSGQEQEQGGKPCQSRLGDLDRSEAASRGSWGSLLFLFSAGGRRYIASLGAVITILSLAFGTFTQQLLTFDSSLAVTDPQSNLQPGNIQRSETWNSWVGNPAEGLTAWGPPLNVKAAIVNGILTDGVASLTASCPTGNCTWPLTPSLGVCGGCVPSTYTTQCAVPPDNVGAMMPTCNYTLSSGSVVTLGNFKYDQYGNGATGFSVLSNGQGAYYNGSRDHRLYIANFDLFGAPYGWYGGSGAWPNQSTVSSECALWMCVQTYQTSMYSGHQTQTVVSTFSDNNATYVDGDLDSTDANYSFASLPAGMDGGNSSFTVDYMAADALTSYLSSTLNGTIFLNLESFRPSSDAVEGIWNGTTHLDAWINNLALSMANVVRNSALVSRPAYDGTAYQLGITVRWGWMALPVAMVFSSVLLLAAVIINTARSPVAAWKGSFLAYLLFDIDEETRRSIEGKTDGYQSIKEAVGSKRAVLKGSRGGIWRFQTV